MDVKYHKQCWTKHVFRVLGADTAGKGIETDTPMQRACLIELINPLDYGRTS